jgi:hypothetical protein
VRQVFLPHVHACAPVKVVAAPVHACAPVKVFAPPVQACAPVKACDPVHEHLAALHAHIYQVFHGTWLKGHRHEVVQYEEPTAIPVQSDVPPAPAPALPKPPAPPAPAKA